MNVRRIAITSLLTALALSGCAVAGQPVASATIHAHGVHTLHHEVTDYRMPYVTTAGVCAGVGGFADMREGNAITFYGANGDVVGSASLGSGIPFSYGCGFAWSTDLPLAAGPFQIEVAHRGRIPFTATEALTVSLDTNLNAS